MKSSFIYIYIFIYNILNVILQLSVFTSWKLVSFRIITISYRNTLLGYCTTFYTHRLLFRNSLGMFRLSVTTTRLLKSHEIAHLSYRSIVTYEISCTVNLIATTIPFIRGHTFISQFHFGISYFTFSINIQSYLCLIDPKRTSKHRHDRLTFLLLLLTS